MARLRMSLVQVCCVAFTSLLLACTLCVEALINTACSSITATDTNIRADNVLLMATSNVGSNNDERVSVSQQRREFFRSISSPFAVSLYSSSTPIVAVAASAQDVTGEKVTVPLEWNEKIQGYLVCYRIDGDLFRAVVDTGSPFLTIPGTCDPTTKFKWGCYRNEGVPSGLKNTFEQFDGVEGEVEWRTAQFTFANATGSMIGPPKMIFGVLSPRLQGLSGGVFFGLVRDTDSWIRPSFLGQTVVEAFNIDLASAEKSLTLSTTPLIGRDDDYIQLVNDLRRRYGDPTLHYTAKVKKLTVNGSPLAASDGKPIFAIIDTGVTGMIVSREIFDERYISARAQKERKMWNDVVVSFNTARGKAVTLTADAPLTTPFGGKPWKNFDAHLIVLGLSFLEGNNL
eukprot:CAMPEP_0113577146 /NCGR_PEP_ID=MMETSP0015_2-20120614/28712_1 /TAXON_ID=2838 /ORGANISM="Odontella" /LENGTH=398 /DNA_ID=CAMNT_0000480705 /DNA_START=17 /DNA_END=1210 /DNA_ORIENTATION=+ /assembly_acc=CAM_ASM_000160